MRTQGYDLEGLSQANAVLNISNSAVMEQLEHMTVTMDAIQDQLKTVASAQTNQAMPKKSSTSGVAGSISLTWAKPDHQKNGTPR